MKVSAAASALASEGWFAMVAPQTVTPPIASDAAQSDLRKSTRRKWVPAGRLRVSGYSRSGPISKPTRVSPTATAMNGLQVALPRIPARTAIVTAAGASSCR